MKPQEVDHALPSVLVVWDGEYPWDVRTQKLCDALGTAGFRAQLTARNRRREAEREELPEAAVHRLPRWPKVLRHLDAASAFPAFVNPRWASHLADVALRTTPVAVIARDLPLAPLAIRLARRHGVPVLLDMAEHYPAMVELIWASGAAGPLDVLLRNPRLVTALERWTLRRLDGVFVDTPEQGTRLEALGVPTARLVLARNTPPRSAVPADLPVKPSGPIEFLYLGILEQPRGITELLEAFARVLAGGADAHLTIVGDGRDAALFRRQAVELGLEAPVLRFTGFLPRAEAQALVDRAHVGVNPIRANPKHDVTVPNKLYDYLAAGAAVLTSDSPPSAREVRRYDAGEVFRSGDVGSLAEAMLRLCRPGRAVELGARGRAGVLADGLWEVDAERIGATLRALVGTGAW